MKLREFKGASKGLYHIYYRFHNVTIKDITTESIVPIDTFLREG